MVGYVAGFEDGRFEGNLLRSINFSKHKLEEVLVTTFVEGSECDATHFLVLEKMLDSLLQFRHISFLLVRYHQSHFVQ